MITSLKALKAALKRPKGSRLPSFTGVILYEGPSMIDGAPIVVIANRIMNASTNAKTGALVQSFIIRSDMTPLEALRLGLDASVCGQCIMRPALGGACYVNVGRSVRSVFEAYQNGRYARAGIDFDAALLPLLFEGLGFRLGTYGDPCAAPFQIWRHATLKAAFVNGYTHQWKDKRFAAFKLLCMASCDSIADLAEAVANKWRSFRVRHASGAKMDNEVICPASHEAGQKTSCAACKACGGTSAKAKASMVIIAHGTTAARFAA